MKSKHARRDRFQLKEQMVGELLTKLQAWEKTLTMGTAFNVAVIEALKVMPKLGIGGKVDGELLGTWLAAEINRQFKIIITPKVAETGEMEFE